MNLRVTNLFLSVLLLLPFVLFSQSTLWLQAGKTVAGNGTFIQPDLSAPGLKYSDNGLYHCTYEVGAVGDEYRELKKFNLYRDQTLLYTTSCLPGSDIMLSNSGIVAAFDHHLQFDQLLMITWFNNSGHELFSDRYKGASFFIFSPAGDEFVTCASGIATVINLNTGSKTDYRNGNMAAFSEDGSILSLADENGTIRVVDKSFNQSSYSTGSEFLRKISVSGSSEFVAAIDKKTLYVFSFNHTVPVFVHGLDKDLSYRDLEIRGDKFVTGIHFKKDGISKGILEVYDMQGNVISSEIQCESTYKTFGDQYQQELKSGKKYDAIPWPFEPFNEVHTVWNHYEQHMGDGSSNWAYLHQGLDMIVPIGEPVYAVQAGYVKCVLSIGGDYYWRIGISPEQSSGYSDGWLYAHIIQSTIQVSVGDYVNLHDYLGNIIDWGPDWGHIHFVQIRDQGSVWSYDDDEWGINFNPLLALDPITDPVAPVIENSASGKKFEFCTNETSTYQEAQNLHGNIDILVKVSDFYADSPWEQPAFTTWYTVKKLPENYVVFPKTLGQILNHTYSFYNSTHFEEWASLYYKMDSQHPSPYWESESRDYWHILTNNNGDSIAELSEKQLSFPTQDYNDGDYRIVVEVYDEFGNSDIDSMEVKFVNGNTTGFISSSGNSSPWQVFPNPASDNITVIPAKSQYYSDIFELKLYDGQMRVVREFDLPEGDSGKKLRLDTTALEPGVYFLMIKNEKEIQIIKVVVM